MPTGEFIIITGLSGAGKTLSMRCLEDLNFFCVDNMPPTLIPKFAQLCNSSHLRRVALVVDIRSREFFAELQKDLQELPEIGFRYRILFLEASDEVLVRRFSETRRKHPMATTGRLLQGINSEREILKDLRGMADKVVDTSRLTPAQIKREITNLFAPHRDGKLINITIVSFGYKFGIPMDADLVFDVRFLPNPFYEEALSKLSGKDPEVREYILKFPESKEFIRKLHELHEFLIPQFVRDGKAHLTIGIGCTGGRHRSVAVSEELARFLEGLDYRVTLEHRDIRK